MVVTSGYVAQLMGLQLDMSLDPRPLLPRGMRHENGQSTNCSRIHCQTSSRSCSVSTLSTTSHATLLACARTGPARCAWRRRRPSAAWRAVEPSPLGALSLQPRPAETLRRQKCARCPPLLTLRSRRARGQARRGARGAGGVLRRHGARWSRARSGHSHCSPGQRKLCGVRSVLAALSTSENV